MNIFFYKGLTGNPEVGNTPSEFCPIYGDWSILNTKFGTNVSNRMLLNATRITGTTPGAINNKDEGIAVSLARLNNFWRTLEMTLISCNISLIINWSVYSLLLIQQG